MRAAPAAHARRFAASSSRACARARRGLIERMGRLVTRLGIGLSWSRQYARRNSRQKRSKCLEGGACGAGAVVRLEDKDPPRWWRRKELDTIVVESPRGKQRSSRAVVCQSPIAAGARELIALAPAKGIARYFAASSGG